MPTLSIQALSVLATLTLILGQTKPGTFFITSLTLAEMTGRQAVVTPPPARS